MVELIGRMMLALGVVLAIMWLLAKWARKPLGGKSDKVITVLARQQLSRAASVAVVKIADRALVIGVTEQSVQLLTEADLAMIETTLTVEDVQASPRELSALELSDLEAGAADAELLEAAFALDSAGAGMSPRRAGSRGAAAPRTRAASRSSAHSSKSAALDGSILSPKTWKQLMQGAKDLTVRR